MKRRILDLFCGQGGSSMGYAQAGFEVVGIDINPQPNYPFEFIQKDILEIKPGFLKHFDVISSSPPCKTHTCMKAFSGSHWQDLIPQTRKLLQSSKKPYIIENVPGSSLIDPVTLCGSMFGVYLRRHRIFETNWPLRIDLECDHEWQEQTSPGFIKKDYHGGAKQYRSPIVSVFGRGEGLGPGEKKMWEKEMGINWMTMDGLRESIPPFYTRYIGLKLKIYLIYLQK